MAESILESGSVVIKCKNREYGCSFEGPRKDIDKHEEEACVHRSVECPLEGCRMRIRAMDLVEHLELTCQVNKAKCSNLGCNERLTPGELTTHALSCGFRMVSCPNAPGCDVIMRASHKHIHLQYECIGRMLKCDNEGCHFKVLAAPLEMSSHSATCQFRIVTCIHQGCQVKTRADKIKDHEAECQFRVVTCPQHSCGHKTLFRSMGDHIRTHADFIRTKRSLGEASSQRLPFLRGWEVDPEFGWFPFRVDVDANMFFCNAYRNQDGLHLWASMLGSPSEAEQFRCHLNVVGSNDNGINGIQFTTKVFPINVERDSAISHSGCLQVGSRTIEQMLVGDARVEQVIEIGFGISQL